MNTFLIYSVTLTKKKRKTGQKALPHNVKSVATPGLSRLAGGRTAVSTICLLNEEAGRVAMSARSTETFGRTEILANRTLATAQGAGTAAIGGVMANPTSLAGQRRHTERKSQRRTAADNGSGVLRWHGW